MVLLMASLAISWMWEYPKTLKAKALTFLTCALHQNICRYYLGSYVSCGLQCLRRCEICSSRWLVYRFLRLCSSEELFSARARMASLIDLLKSGNNATRQSLFYIKPEDLLNKILCLVFLPWSFKIIISEPL
jgi:hypothetical protein